MRMAGIVNRVDERVGDRPQSAVIQGGWWVEPGSCETKLECSAPASLRSAVSRGNGCAMSHGKIALDGKVAVVLGGTSGLGRAIALGLADAGANVVATSRDLAKVSAVAREIRSLQRRTLEQSSDVTDAESLQRLLAAVTRELGHVAVMVNCAARTQRVATLDQSETEWQSILATNLEGTFRACQVFGRAMVARGSGSIINIASLASFAGFLEVAAYGASKAGVVGLTKALAVEWANHGVRVNAIAPGVFPTALNQKLLEGTARGAELIARTPMGRFGHPDEVAGAAVYLASDSASFVTGSVLHVDGGFLASGVNQ